MAYPSTYTRDYSFQGFQAGAPSSPLPGIKVDTSLDEIANAITGLIAFLRLIERSDGALNNGIVTLEALDPQVAAAINIALPGRTTVLESEVALLETEVATLIAEVNGSADPGPYIPLTSLPLRTSQFLAALSATVPNAVATLNRSISANRDDAVRIVFSSEPFCLPHGVLANYAQTLFGLSDGQMSAIFALATPVGTSATLVPLTRLPVRLSQFLLALVAGSTNGTGVTANPVSTIVQALAASEDDPLSVAFNHGGFIAPGDPLTNFIQTALNLTASQLVILFYAAKSQAT